MKKFYSSKTLLKLAGGLGMHSPHPPSGSATGTSLLLRQETIPNCLGHQGDLIYRRSSSSATCLIESKQRVDDRLDAGVNNSLKYLMTDTERKNWSMAFSILQRFVRLRDGNYKGTPPNFWSFKLV